MSTKYDFRLGYPKRDGFRPRYGERLKYITYPLRINTQRYIAAEIQLLEDGTWIHEPIHRIEDGLYVEVKLRTECLRGCEIHNNFEFGEGNWEHIVAEAIAV